MSTNLLEPPISKPPTKAPPKIPPIPPKIDEGGGGGGGGGSYRNFGLRLLFTYLFLFLMFIFLATARTAYDHKYIISTYILGILGCGSYLGYVISYIMLLDCMGDAYL
jgi:hypothetical protein